MANNASKLSSLDAEKADRAAASIRPSWEFDQADFEPTALPPAPAGGAPATKVEGFEHKLAIPAISSPAKTKDVPFAAGADIPRDTVIDGVPTVAVGRTIDIGPAPEDVQAKPDRAPPPPRPQATRFGLGSDPGPPEQSAASPDKSGVSPPAGKAGKTANGTSIIPRTSPEAAAAAAAAEAAGVAPVAAFSPGDVAEIAPLDPASATEGIAPASPHEPAAIPSERVESVPPAAPTRASPPADAPVAPIAASISRIEDPIEIPRKSSGPIVWVLGGAVALAAIIGGVVMLTGGEKPSNDTTKSTSSPTPEKPTATTGASAAPTAPPAPTTAATPAGTPTAESSAAPSATTALSAAPSAEASAAPAAKPTSAPTNPTTPPKSTGTAPKQPPPKGTGGIRRDTPF